MARLCVGAGLGTNIVIPSWAAKPAPTIRHKTNDEGQLKYCRSPASVQSVRNMMRQM